jgi:hypothetical protein
MTMRNLVAVNSPDTGNDLETPSWAEARARLALYLKALQLPDAEAARLLEQAVSRAKAAEPALPLPAAMAALHDLLAQRSESPQPVAMRPMRRGVMVPAPIDRSALRFLVDELLVPMAATGYALLLGRRRRQGLVGVIMLVGAATAFAQIR